MSLKTTDPEFIERFEHFALGEVVNDESCRLDTECCYKVLTREEIIAIIKESL